MSLLKTADLFSIASSGVNASNRLLQTTSNNIANVNTEGFVRERTNLTAELIGGVGEGNTERLVNQFALNQVRRDKTNLGEWQVYNEKIGGIDNLLGNEGSSLATGLSEFFASVQTASDDPSSLASRDVVFGKAQVMLSRLSSMSDFLNFKEKEVNLEFDTTVNRANTLLANIAELNKAVVLNSGESVREEPGALLNQRDEALKELASIISIEVRAGANNTGGLAVNLTSGESLVLEDGTFNVLALSSEADPTFKRLQLSTDFVAKNNTVLNLVGEDVGGQIGGLFRYRDEVLGTVQRDVGQLAAAFGDAINSQNRLGMDLDQQLGDNIFNLPTFTALPYQGTPGTLSVTGQFTEGSGDQITDADVKITVTAVNGANQPTQITVELIEGNGSPKLDSSGNPIVLTGVAVTTGFNEIAGGIEIEFDPAGTFAVDNEFLLQPTKFAASNMSFATTRAEDLAFALPIRLVPSANNFGDLSVANTVVTNTVVGTGADRSAFDGANNIDNVASSPSATLGAPAQIIFNSTTEYRVLDAAGSTITVVSGVTDYNNLLAQAEATGAGPAWPAAFSGLDDYPGYDASLTGTPQPGDSFTFEYNANGLDDNRNANLMIDLQEQPKVQLSSESTNEPRTLFEAYASLVGGVGEKSATADISLQAAETMLSDSEEWFQSVSGVSLDEEAANLIKFQQAYAASARILQTAQELFDTIIAAVR